MHYFAFNLRTGYAIQRIHVFAGNVAAHGHALTTRGKRNSLHKSEATNGESWRYRIA